MKVDCHIHSLYSDGVFTVKEIVELLQENKVELFSLTDHDTIDGITEAKEYSSGILKFISGVEFTCKEEKFSLLNKKISIHLLGYNIDENNQDLIKMLENRKENVNSVYDDLCRKITDLGYPISKNNIPISCGIVLQFCDVINYLKSNYANISDDVFMLIEEYMIKLNAVNISISEAITSIHNAGGKAIWAHPFNVYNDFEKMSIDRTEVLCILNTLRKMGLDGIEANYLAFSDEQRQWLMDIVENYGLLYTVGSDFHGSVGRNSIGISI